MENQKQCEFCNKDAEGIYGNRICKVPFAHDENEITISVDMKLDNDEESYISAYVSIFGAVIQSKPVYVKYCPFCGRKL